LKFSGLILENSGYDVFKLLMQKSDKKRDTKIEGKKRKETRLFSQLFWQKAFGMDFPQKFSMLSGIFELPLLSKCTNTPQKSRNKKKKREKGTYPNLVGIDICQIYVAFSF
jgi:hypothetical protein